MAKVTGIDLGEHAVRVVGLDGSYRKTRLTGHQVVALAAGADGAERGAAIAQAVRTAIDEGGLDGDLRLGYPSREAVLRHLEVPFSGHDAIRRVIKGEIEGEIHSHAVDDMVVDFHEVGKGAEGTKVLVAAVPKAPLRGLLDTLEGSGIEPEHVDLDLMALYRVADWCGAFAGGDVPAAAGGAGGAAAAPITVVLDLGARSTRVLLVEGDNLVDMRTLRLGAAGIDEDVARKHAMPVALAREAVTAVNGSRADWRGEVPTALPAPVGDEAAPASPEPPRAVTVTLQQVEAAQTTFLQRLSRELVRFLAATGRADRIRGVWITGGASRIAGMHEMLAAVFGTEIHELDVLARLQHDLSPEEATAIGPTLAISIGLALAALGGPDGFELRQENLAFTRGFDRVKFPLAITCMVALFALLVFAFKLNNDLRGLEYRLGRTWQAPNQKLPGFHGMLNAVVNRDKWFEQPQYFRYEAGKDRFYKYDDLVKDLAARPVHERLKLVLSKLRLVTEQKQKDSGVFEDVSTDSGLAVLVRFAEVLRRMESSLGRYLVVKLDLNMRAPRYLEATIAFRGDDFRERLALLEEGFRTEFSRPDTPFEQDKSREGGTPLDRFRDAPDQPAGSGVQGAYCRFRVGVKESFRPFGGSAPQIGQLEGPSGREPNERLAAGLLAAAGTAGEVGR